MCGIIAAFSTKIKTKKTEILAEDVNKFIINQYEDQKSRGERGFGIIRIGENNEVEVDRATEPTKFILDLYTKKSNMIIAHHRQPTSTDNKLAQTHPIFVSNETLKKEYYVIHNGIISNSHSLRDKHIKDFNFEYTTEYQEVYKYSQTTGSLKFNDSEALAIELALYIEKKKNFIETKGGAAFIVLEMNKETGQAEKVYFGKNTSYSDLKMSKSRGKLRISSEGEGEDVKEETLYSFKIDDPLMKLSKRKIIIKEEEKKEEKSTIGFINEHSSIRRDKWHNDDSYGDDEWNGWRYGEHSTLCRCSECKEIQKKEEELDEKDETKIITIETEDTINARSWQTSDFFTDLDIKEEKYLEKDYKWKRREELKEWLRETSAEDIEYNLKTFIDEDKDFINELMDTYTDILMERQISKEERAYFLRQIIVLFRSIENTINLAEDEYNELKINEEEKNLREIEEYNAGFQKTLELEEGRHGDRD